ncbi:MAG: hypothetical protein IPH88_17765 [Bacteroidales bacterium]|nr:hypothetical protein [Bacteroidales bacterium]
MNITPQRYNKNISVVLPFLLILALGFLYMRHTWNRIEKQADSNLLQVARSIEASLPAQAIADLQANQSDINNSDYLIVKQTLKEVIKVNEKARFAYIYKAKGDKIFFLADSEPITSEDYSPPGQEFPEADESDWLPLKKGEFLVTDPLTDRWGTWVSVLVPIQNKATGQPIAVFGMDFNATIYRSMLMSEMMRSGVIIALLMLLLLFLIQMRGNNLKLKNEIKNRIAAERTILQQNEELKQLNLTKDKFFSIIAHDLRGPFAGFLGLTEILAKTLYSMSLDEILKFAQTMEKSSKNLYRLLENLLQWSLLQRNVIRYEPEYLNLKSLTIESTEATVESCASKEIEFSIRIKDDEQVYADRQMLTTIIRNMVSNAFKFTPKAGKIYIDAMISDDNWIQISITDSGIGMPEKTLNNLFKLEAPSSRPGIEGEPSTGLGLILCKEFIEKHGGYVKVQSKEKEGSTFSFSIPANEHAAQQKKAA